MKYHLQIRLLSDACFSSGAGHVVQVDTEIEYDDFTGLPIIRGKTIRGLLVEECAFICGALQAGSVADWALSAAARLFGNPGNHEPAMLAISTAQLPGVVQTAVIAARTRPDHKLSSQQILRSLTSIRRQTKMTPAGVPEEHSLRATRTALHSLVFFSRLDGVDELKSDDKALLAACILATRRGGLNRNRGWGRLECRLLADGNDITSQWIQGICNHTREVSS